MWKLRGLTAREDGGPLGEGGEGRGGEGRGGEGRGGEGRGGEGKELIFPPQSRRDFTMGS